MGRGWKNFEVHVRKSLDCLEEAIGINMNVKGNSGQTPDGNRKHVIGNWGKILVIKCQRTWLNRVPVLCGRENL